MTEYVQASEESVPVRTNLARIDPDAAPAISPVVSAESPVGTNLVERSYQPASPLEAAADRIQAMTRFIQMNSPRLMTSVPGRKVVAGWYQTLRLEKAAFKENVLAQRDANAATQLAGMMPQLTEARLLAVPTGGGRYQIVRMKGAPRADETWEEYGRRTYQRYYDAAERRIINTRKEQINVKPLNDAEYEKIESLAKRTMYYGFSTKRVKDTEVPSFKGFPDTEEEASKGFPDTEEEASKRYFLNNYDAARGQALTELPKGATVRDVRLRTEAILRAGRVNRQAATSRSASTNAPTGEETWVFRDGKYVQVK